MSSRAGASSRRPAGAGPGDHARRVDAGPTTATEAERAARRACCRTPAASVRVGITGAPGVGKSTFIEALGLHLVERGHRVAVLAVDPSSTRSGGSILGDKTRMERARPRAEPRSSARRRPAARSAASPAAPARRCCCARRPASTSCSSRRSASASPRSRSPAWSTSSLLLLAPGGGDELQGIKRGIIELADLVVVNKADGDLAAAAQRGRRRLRVGTATCCGRSRRDWEPRVLLASALEGDGRAPTCGRRSRSSGPTLGALGRPRPPARRAGPRVDVVGGLREPARLAPAATPAWPSSPQQLEDAVRRGERRARGPRPGAASTRSCGSRA